jgi:hypothetical protein
MEGRIPDDILTDIRARVSIVEVIGAHVALRKSGNYRLRFMAKDPSFSVNESGVFTVSAGWWTPSMFLTRIECPFRSGPLPSPLSESLPRPNATPRTRERARLSAQ